MGTFQKIIHTYEPKDVILGPDQLEQFKDDLGKVDPEEIESAADGERFILLLKKFRETVERNNRLNGDNYPHLLKSLLAVGADGLYSDNLRFIFELIQNVDDCSFPTPDDCKLDMQFDFNGGRIILTYNETGFTPFNVFAITGIAEAAKNITAHKKEIGEKGIGFKSVFGVATKVLIRSGWFSFELHKDHFTIPIPAYADDRFHPGTEMTLFMPAGKTRSIYDELKEKYCEKDALFNRNPLLFLNKLTYLKMHFDIYRSMEFCVSRSEIEHQDEISREDNIIISVDLHDHDHQYHEVNETKKITCTRYTYNVNYGHNVCKSRYGVNTAVGSMNGKDMHLQVVVPHIEDLHAVGNGSLYSFLPTKLKLTVPIVCHVPFKLDASREFVDDQDENLWFRESSKHFANLMMHVYSDWSKTVKEQILYYLPGISESLVAKNNGKEHCLRKQSVFSGSYFLEQPLLHTTNGQYHCAKDILCFDPAESLPMPESVHRMMNYQRDLFIPPTDIDLHRFGIQPIQKVYLKLFNLALLKPEITAEALKYLDDSPFEYPSKSLSLTKSLPLVTSQIIEIMKYPALVNIFQSTAVKSIREAKRPSFVVEAEGHSRLQEILYSGFDPSETPKLVAQYLKTIGYNCLCMDIGERQYLPCYNAIILSRHNPLSAFAAFCRAIDDRDTFAIRVALREASERLNQYVDNNLGSPEEYLKLLRDIRRIVKDSLGKKGYKNYLDLILKSGTDKGRFIQELLQNADDCQYPSGVIPSFSVSVVGTKIITECNEVGFNRNNIRAITAIGESTKNRLLDGKLQTIGEKGVGFKSIFAVASEVKIYSGDYNFSLSDQEPTIPKLITSPLEKVSGTKMEISLKNGNNVPDFTDKALLELCLCLRNLKQIVINGRRVSIEDSNDIRTIKVDRKTYQFKRFKHRFTVSNKEAIAECENGSRLISPVQQIVCYVPEKNEQSEYPLYSGLPTKHKIKVPMIIDAPFELTTSREEIELGSILWNDAIRKEMYAAILNVIEELRHSQRARVLRFARFVPRRLGSDTRYFNDISDTDYINDFGYLSLLSKAELLPTFDFDVFVAPIEKKATRFPRVANLLFANGEFGYAIPAGIIDLPGTEYDPLMNALKYETAGFEKVLPILEQHAERNIQNDVFRETLYEYLQNAPSEYHSRVAKLAIIPVYGSSAGTTNYISWKEESIFVKKGANTSSDDYYVLNDTLLPKSSCEKMLGVNINEMNKEWEQTRYNEKLHSIIRGSNMEDIYYYLISEFSNGMFAKYNSIGTLLELKEYIPLKNQCNEITVTELFLCNQPEGYFPVDIIRKSTVHQECTQFAALLKCKDLSTIYYEDIRNNTNGLLLTADDVETLIDEYFKNSDEILRGFYQDGLLLDELLTDYNLDYIVMGRGMTSYQQFVFPENPVKNFQQLRAHIKKQMQNPIRIISERVERTVQRGKRSDGSTFALDSNDARKKTLTTYSPEGSYGQCFCQMCRRVKPYSLIEVNNIQTTPEYYFDQMRVSLCLECSKHFEALRSNTKIRDAYIAAIKNAKITTQGTIDIPIGNEEKLTFTATHLAEIQEILKNTPQKLKSQR